MRINPGIHLVVIDERTLAIHQNHVKGTKSTLIPKKYEHSRERHHLNKIDPNPTCRQAVLYSTTSGYRPTTIDI
mgnify:CR=1 FL=1